MILTIGINDENKVYLNYAPKDMEPVALFISECMDPATVFFITLMEHLAENDPALFELVRENYEKQQPVVAADEVFDEKKTSN